jgi:hypothetical protein
MNDFLFISNAGWSWSISRILFALNLGNLANEGEVFLNTLDPEEWERYDLACTLLLWRKTLDVEIIQVAYDYGCPCHHSPKVGDSNQLLGDLLG